MATKLEQNLSYILSEKTNKLVPENIKLGVQILGITGNYEGEDRNIKLYDNIETMEADQNQPEGMYGTVYGKEESPITGTTEFQQVRFPAKVTLSSEVTSEFSARFRSTGGSWVDMNVYVTPTSAEISAYGDSGELQVEYASSDGIHYIREGDTETYDLGTTVIYEDYGEPFDSRLGQFILASAPAYNGLYQHNPYSDNTQMHFIPTSSIIKTNSGTSATFNWDGTFTQETYRADKLKELAHTLHPTEYPTAGAYYNIYFALDENKNLIAYELFSDANKTTVIDDKQTLYTYFTNTNSYGLSVFNSGSNVILDIYDINIDDYTYTYRTTLNVTTKNGNYMRIEGLQVSTLPIAEMRVMYDYDSTYKLVYNMYKLQPSGTVRTTMLCANETSILNSNYLKWQICPNQFTLSDGGDLIAGKIALGTSGAITGSLGESFSSSFDDTAANLYEKAQTYYDTLTPVIFNDGDSLSSKFGTTNIIVIPSKTDGTPLIDISNMTNTYMLFHAASQYLESLCEVDISNSTNTHSMFNRL